MPDLSLLSNEASDITSGITGAGEIFTGGVRRNRFVAPAPLLRPNLRAFTPALLSFLWLLARSPSDSWLGPLRRLLPEGETKNNWIGLNSVSAMYLFVWFNTPERAISTHRPLAASSG